MTNANSAICNMTDEGYVKCPIEPSVDEYCIKLPKDRELALNALELISHLEENWNGHGAVKPSGYSIKYAEQFIRLIPLPYYAPNEIYSDDEGDIVLIWKNNNRLIVTIEPMLIHFSNENGSDDLVLEDNIQFDGESIPQKIIKYLPLRKK